ncbi:MAG: motility protein A [Deltaproteobacteria bacterium]|nr:motility protein A [Deltaproteobacteria bacterium]
MDVSTLIGILVASGLVIVSISMGGSVTWFINYPSLMIVIGGTMGATLLAYPLSEVMSVFGVAKNVFLHRYQNQNELISLLVRFARKARKEGILSFESELKNVDNPFMVKGLNLAIDGMDSGAIEDILRTEIYAIEERHRLGADIFLTMGNFSPAVGMLGTIIGLVQMLMQMNDPSNIGKPMAVALLTTFYGVFLSYLFFLPIAGKLKTRSKKELIINEMIMEGIISIQAGDNPRVVEQKLKAFLSPRERKLKSRSK